MRPLSLFLSFYDGLVQVITHDGIGENRAGFCFYQAAGITARYVGEV
jgi:hypothetical protein